MKKRILIAIWIMVCMLGLAACGGGQGNDGQKPQNGSQEQEEQQEIMASYPENYVKRVETGLFGNEAYGRNDILTITIKDSLDGMMYLKIKMVLSWHGLKMVQTSALAEKAV